ncbi:MAG: substrate-binding domain-containing protein [Clostridia bacterium]|nr:substrate-binding domain-containing protein [Clostridia bacterium]
MAISEKVTIAQIAAKANVSIATASRVINSPGLVKEETRIRVMQAMKDLDCQIKRPANKMILASFTDFNNPFYGRCISAMQEAARKRGYYLYLQQIENPADPTCYNTLLNDHTFQGILFCHRIPEGDVLDNIRMSHPIVMCSQYNVNSDIPYVTVDDFTAAKNAVNYLVSIGKKKIAFINSTLKHSYSVLREKGYRAALENAGLPIHEEWIVHIPYIDFDTACAAVFSMLRSTDVPDAFFCASDVYACAALKAASAMKKSVPGDISVLGFDNIAMTTMTVPTLSTVSQPVFQLGYQSCNMLIDIIEGIPVVTPHVMLDTEIIIRNST